MLALGGFLICAALLALAASALAFRRPQPPRWTTMTWVGELLSVAIASAFAVGLADLVAGLVRAAEAGPSLVDLGLLAAVLLVTFVIWRRLDLRARLKGFEAREARLGAAGGSAGKPAAMAAAAERSPQPTPRVA